MFEPTYIHGRTHISCSDIPNCWRVLLALLHQDIKASKTANLAELKAFKFAAVRLHITSPLSLMIEKRSIRKLLTQIRDFDTAKKEILNYLLYLMRKYGKYIKTQETEGDDDVFDSFQPPMKFKNLQLSVFFSCSSVPSFNSSLDDLNLQVDNVSFQSSDTNSSDFGTENEIKEKCMVFKCGTNLFIHGNLSVLPWASRSKAIEDVKNQLKNDEESHGFISTSYVKPVFKFLKEAHRLGDSGAKRHGSKLLLIFLKECRTDVPPLPKEVMSNLSEITEEALQILELLSFHQYYSSEIVASGILQFILQLIKNPNSKHHNMGLKVLCNLSAHTGLAHHLINLGFIHHPVPFLDDLLLSGFCVKIFKNLCTIEEYVAHFVENEHCIALIGELLEVGKDEEQENSLDILLLLCYQREELCETLMQDSIVSSLVNILRNGSCKGRLISLELLQLLNNVPDDHSQVFSLSNTSQSTNGNLKIVNSCFK